MFNRHARRDGGLSRRCARPRPLPADRPCSPRGGGRGSATGGNCRKQSLPSRRCRPDGQRRRTTWASPIRVASRGSKAENQEKPSPPSRRHSLSGRARRCRGSGRKRLGQWSVSRRRACSRGLAPGRGAPTRHQRAVIAPHADHSLRPSGGVQTSTWQRALPGARRHRPHGLPRGEAIPFAGHLLLPPLPAEYRGSAT